jgi:uncharacterized phiE125 gp8 family phage protein
MLTLISIDDSPPITLDELKAHLHYDGSDHDDRLEAIIEDSCVQLERATNRSLRLITWEDTQPQFYKRMWLDFPPLNEVLEVTYYDANNEQQTLDAEDYIVSKPYLGKGSIQAIDQWPETYCRPDAVTIRFQAGYETVPNDVKRVLLQVCGYNDCDREGTQQNFAALNRAINLIRCGGIV